MQKNHPNYIIITPCKNEEWNFSNLIQSVLAQTIRPILWTIVDDGSTDDTRNKLAQAERNQDWIKGIYLEGQKEYLGSHIANVYNEGFKYAKEYSKEYNLNYKYIAILDADTIPEPEYFEKLLQEFGKNPKLGIASGNTFEHTENIAEYLKNGKIDITDIKFWETYQFSLKEIDIREDLPMGSARMWRKECFEETGGGYDNVHIPDAVSTVKAKIKGWETKRFKNIKLIERRGLIARGYWYGYKERGASNYVIGLPLNMVLMKTLKYLLKKPYYIGISYFYGYIYYYIHQKKRITDLEVRRYYRFIHTAKSKNISRKSFLRFIKETLEIKG